MEIDPLSIKSGSERTVYLLATLAKLEKSVRIQELIHETGLAQSTLYRQLALLKKWGFVVERDGLYTPGPMCLPLAWGFDQSSYLVEHAHPSLVELSKNSGESVGLFVIANHYGICLDMVESMQSLRCSFSKARSFPLVRGATAKALLAFASDQEQANIIESLKHEEHLAGSEIEQLIQQLAHIQQQGFATSNSEVDDGIWGVSCPLSGPHHQSSAVITLMAPNSRIAGREQHFIDQTQRAAQRITTRLLSL